MVLIGGILVAGEVPMKVLWDTLASHFNITCRTSIPTELVEGGGSGCPYAVESLLFILANSLVGSSICTDTPLTREVTFSN